MPKIVASQNEINLSITVAAALMDGETPAVEKIRIIVPSIAPRPPGRRGIMPTKEDTMNTSAIIMKLTLAPNAKNTK